MKYIKFNRVENTCFNMEIEAGTSVKHSTNDDYLISAENAILDIVNRLVSMAQTLPADELQTRLLALNGDLTDEERVRGAITAFGYTYTDTDPEA